MNCLVVWRDTCVYGCMSIHTYIYIYIYDDYTYPHDEYIERDIDRENERVEANRHAESETGRWRHRNSSKLT